MDAKKIERINELARKAKSEGLTDKELTERDALRKEYIAEFRGNLKNTLDHITIVNPDGSRKSLKPKAPEMKN